MARVVNFNHLVEKNELMKMCYSYGHKVCYYQPVGDGQTTTGNNYHVTMRCKNCGRRSEVFMTEKQYKQHSKVLEKEVGGV